MTFGLMFKYGLASLMLGVNCGVLVVLVIVGLIGLIGDLCK